MTAAFSPDTQILLLCAPSVIDPTIPLRIGSGFCTFPPKLNLDAGHATQSHTANNSLQSAMSIYSAQCGPVDRATLFTLYTSFPTVILPSFLASFVSSSSETSAALWNILVEYPARSSRIISSLNNSIGSSSLIPSGADPICPSGPTSNTLIVFGSPDEYLSSTFT